MFFIESEEVRIVLESRGKTGVAYGVSAADEVVDEVDAAKNEIVAECYADLLAEKVADVIFAVIKFVGDIRKRYVLCVMRVQILQNFKYQLVFDARGIVRRLAAVRSFADCGKKLDDLTAQKDGIGTSDTRGVAEDIAHKSVAADLAHTFGTENVSDAALSFVEKFEKSCILCGKAVGDAFADVERDALKDFVCGYRATVKLGGIEDYHIARAEGVKATFNTYFSVSAQKEQEDQRRIVVKLRHQGVFVRVADRVVDAAGGIGIVAYSR